MSYELTSISTLWTHSSTCEAGFGSLVTPRPDFVTPRLIYVTPRPDFVTPRLIYVTPRPDFVTPRRAVVWRNLRSGCPVLVAASACP